ncbi:MAG: hypothetical protein KGM15_08970 [Pseudomonadota bacterium]|nr:hypothetical protein [Pseudomonadota bacterium]
MVALVCALAATPAAAESLFDSLAKSTGLMATPADPPDFVKASRPSEPSAAIPVFAPPDEPRSKVKTPAELKAMDADLERAGRQRRPVPARQPADGKRADKPKPR